LSERIRDKVFILLIESSLLCQVLQVLEVTLKDIFIFNKSVVIGVEFLSCLAHCRWLGWRFAYLTI